MQRPNAQLETTSRGWIFRLSVLLCCLLSFTASFDLAVLLPLVEYNWVGTTAEVVVTEMEDPFEDDSSAMLQPRCSERRSDRHDRTIESLFRQGNPVIWVPQSEQVRLTRSHERAGSEHGLRNGLGAPLLC